MADWLLLLQINSKRWRFTSERKKELKIKTSNLSDRRNDPLWPRACPRWKSLRLLHNIGKFGQRFHLQRQVITQWEVSASISDKEWVIMLRSGQPKNQGLVSIFSFDVMNLKSTERKSIFRISSLDFNKKTPSTHVNGSYVIKARIRTLVQLTKSMLLNGFECLQKI